MWQQYPLYVASLASLPKGFHSQIGAPMENGVVLDNKILPNSLFSIPMLINQNGELEVTIDTGIIGRKPENVTGGDVVSPLKISTSENGTVTWYCKTDPKKPPMTFNLSEAIRKGNTGQPNSEFQILGTDFSRGSVVDRLMKNSPGNTDTERYQNTNIHIDSYNVIFDPAKNSYAVSITDNSCVSAWGNTCTLLGQMALDFIAQNLDMNEALALYQKTLGGIDSTAIDGIPVSITFKGLEFTMQVGDKKVVALNKTGLMQLLQTAKGKTGKPPAVEYSVRKLPEGTYQVQRGTHIMGTIKNEQELDQLIQQDPNFYAWSKDGPEVVTLLKGLISEVNGLTTDQITRITKFVAQSQQVSWSLQYNTNIDWSTIKTDPKNGDIILPSGGNQNVDAARKRQFIDRSIVKLEDFIHNRAELIAGAKANPNSLTIVTPSQDQPKVAGKPENP